MDSQAQHQWTATTPRKLCPSTTIHLQSLTNTLLHRSRDSLPTEFGLHHNKFQFQSAADLHGDSMKQMLNPIRTTTDKSPPRSLLTSSMSDLGRRGPADGRLPPVNVSVQLPIHSRHPYDSPIRDSPVFSAVSPRPTPFHQTPVDQRSPNESSDADRSPRTRTRRNNSEDAVSTQGSFVDDMDMDETSSLKRLHIEEGYIATGHKRRAASPASDDLGFHGLPVDGLRRRDGASRGSPTPRLSTIPQGVPSSYMSTISMAPSAVSAVSSYGHRSPGGGMSPGGPSPTCTSPYTTPASLNPSPRASVSSRAPLHARSPSGASPRKLAEPQKPAGSKLQGFLMCECCPKKPKKFETAEELR